MWQKQIINPIPVCVCVCVCVGGGGGGKFTPPLNFLQYVFFATSNGLTLGDVNKSIEDYHGGKEGRKMRSRDTIMTSSS